MKKLLTGALASAVVMALPVTASQAAEQSAFVAVTSDYVFRGLSSSNDGIAVQGGYDIKQSKDDMGWYAGTFVSTVGDIGSDGLEVDLHGGWKGAINKNVGYAVGGAFYKYTDNNIAGNDTTEIYAGVNYETAYLKIFAGDVDAGGSYNYIDLGATFVVMQDIDLSVHYGRYSSSAFDYNDFSASMSMDVKGFDLGLGLTYEDLTKNNNLKFIATVTKNFDF